MAENKPTNTAAESPAKAQTVNTEATTRPAAPQAKSIDTVEPAVSTGPAETSSPITTDMNSASQEAQTSPLQESTQETPAPVAQKVMGVYENTMSRKERMAVAEKKGYMFLSEAEREIYQKDLDAQHSEDAEAKIKLKDDDKRKKGDEKPDKFSEDDVIKYMYEKWLIAGAEWAAQKLEKSCGTGYEQLKLWTINTHSAMLAESKAFKDSPTFKAQSEIGKITEQKSQEAKSQCMAFIKDVNKTAVDIGNGELFKEGNEEERIDFENFLRKEYGDNAPEIMKQIEEDSKKVQDLKPYVDALSAAKANKSKSKNDAATQSAEREIVAAQRALKEAHKENGSDESQTNLCKYGKEYAQRRNDAIAFDHALRQTAIRMAGANILHDVAENKDAYNGKDLNSVFDANLAASKTTLETTTEKDREKYLSYDYNQKHKYISTYGGMVDVTPQNSMGKIESLRGLYDTALGNERSGIMNKKAKEFGNEPIKNKALLEARNTIKEALENKAAQADAQDKTPEQIAEEEKNKQTEAKKREEEEQARILADKDEQKKQKTDTDENTDKKTDLKTAAEPTSAEIEKNKELENLESKMQQNSQDAFNHQEKGKMFDRPFIANLKNKKNSKEDISAFIDQARQGNVSYNPPKGQVRD